jgi:crotonobetainyl-CoA:carnitine CoA-transferase CaiB-like acyl-CoA transferase
MQGPLRGIRVLDLTHVLNGPFCTLMLAHMGAEVLKVEYGEGDRFRHIWMPPGVKRDGYEFIAMNCNKKGIVLDMKKAEGKKLFIALMKKSDVVVENFSAGAMERLGLGYDVLREINPRIIYACSRGFGESGPYKHVRANAATISAIAGYAHEGMRLSKTPGAKTPSLGDETAGASMCMGILGALYHREKTGTGQKIEVSMHEAILGFMVSSLHMHFEQQEVGPAPKPCNDGYYYFHIPDMTDEAWAKLTGALGNASLASDPRFLTVRDRQRNYAAVEQAISDLVSRKSRREVWEVMSSLGLASAPVLTVGESIEDPHLKARDAFVEIDHPEAGKVKILAPWVRFSATPGAITSPAPLMGQHNREVFGQILGLSAEEIDALERKEVISAAPSSHAMPAKAT